MAILQSWWLANLIIQEWKFFKVEQIFFVCVSLFREKKSERIENKTEGKLSHYYETESEICAGLGPYWVVSLELSFDKYIFEIASLCQHK